MRLEKIKIHQFGKLKNQEIIFQKGINVVYGPNESGKSTLHSYLRGMFFGLPRYRGRAAKTDPYTRFEPWERPVDFGGTLEFSVDEKHFQIDRNFYKGDPRENLVCMTDGEQMSIEQGDLSMLLGGISETIYDNTVSIGQLRAETDEGMIRELQKYISNYEGAGSGEVDLSYAEEKLKKKKREWERKKIDAETEHEQQIHQSELSVEYLEKEIQMLRAQEEETKENCHIVRKKLHELEKEYTQEKVEDQEEPAKEEGADKRNARIIGILLVLLVIGIVFCGYHFWVLGGILWTVFGISGLGIFVSKEYKKKEQERRQRKKLARKKQETSNITPLEKIKEQYSGLFGKQELLHQQIEEKQIQLENLQEALKEARMEAKDVSVCEVEIQSIELAMKVLKELANQMKQKIGGKLKVRMEEILQELTEGKYSHITIDSEMKLSVFEGNREIGLYQLSRGTVEQIYFSLRMAVSEILCEEPMPVLLDDVFAMYDEERLSQALCWLATKKEQVVIFTCHKREMELVKRLGIQANIITMEGTVC